MPQQYNSHRSIGRLDVAMAGVNGLSSLDIVDIQGTRLRSKGHFCLRPFSSRDVGNRDNLLGSLRAVTVYGIGSAAQPSRHLGEIT
jgi:hypothetical protein